jgi:2-aminoethylphosphonate-pyruvate transaminase
MKDYSAIILAAGMGVRMGARGRLMPKGLIELGGRALVAQSVDSLRGFGIGRIRIVTGHLSEQYEAAFAGVDGVELLHNPDFASTGSLLTLQRGLEGLSGPCLVLESDLVYAPAALEAALAGGSRLVTSDATGAGDEVYVWTGEGARLVEISKQADARPEPHFGELVGVTALDAEAAARMPEVAAGVLRQVPAEHYEAGLVALGRQVPIPCVRLDGLPWAEVDDETMLERAERLVYPRVAAARQEWQALA